MNRTTENAMNGILSFTALLALVAWAEGSLVITLPGLHGPEINRGAEDLTH